MENNGNTENTDNGSRLIDIEAENPEDLLPKAISTEILCSELLTLKDSLLISIDPALKDAVDLKYLEDKNYLPKMIDTHFESANESPVSFSEHLCRLRKAKLLYKELNEDIEWLTQNALMINRVFCFGGKHFGMNANAAEKIRSYSNNSSNHQRKENQENRKSLYSALWNELLCVELLALRDAIFVAFDPSLKGLIDLSYFQDTDSSCRLIDLFFDGTPEFRGNENEQKRLKEAKSFYRDIDEQIKWLISNADMISRVLFPYVKKNSQVDRRTKNIFTCTAVPHAS